MVNNCPRSVEIKIKKTGDAKLTAARMRYMCGDALEFTKLKEGTTKRFWLINSEYPWILIASIPRSDGELKVSLKL